MITQNSPRSIWPWTIATFLHIIPLGDDYFMDSFSLKKENLLSLKNELENTYNEIKSKGLNLDMSRGKPCPEQLELSAGLLNNLDSKAIASTAEHIDCRNYGTPDGILEAKEFFSRILEVPAENVFVGGNSSLSLMFDTISQFMTHGVLGEKPWMLQGNIKFLCPCPGYDRHFSILEYFSIKPIVIPMTPQGPDMDLIEKLVESDEKIKGIFCVPKYSNPQGITYSDKTVSRFSKLKPKAKDFRIFWDNAYAIHDLLDEPDNLKNLMKECQKHSTEDSFIMFASTSKVTFAGAGISAIAASKKNLNYIKEKYQVKTIGFDKINQLRHTQFFKDHQAVLSHMQNHRKILAPKFKMVLEHLQKNFAENKLATWTQPNGGYFVSVELQSASAKRVVELCKLAGLKLTPAGAAYPKGQDKFDTNIRIAPSYPSLKELDEAMVLFCVCIKLASIEKM